MMNNIVVGDADGLIALILESDPHYTKAIAINNTLLEQDVMLVFPDTVFPEAITTLKRAFNQPEKAHLINKQLQQGQFHIQYLDEEIFLLASQIFDKAKSKQNTFFDAIVAATAEKLGTKTIFSFDKWYTKLGYQLAGE